MRKTQVALAALALVASSAALANGVTAYGTVDASVVSNSAGTAFGGAGNSAGSIWGLKGSEDLGGGLKAGFNLEGGLNAASGALGANGGVGTALFNRAANVTLGNESATVTFGTQFSPYIGAGLTGVTAVGGNGAFVPGLLRVGASLAGYTYDVSGTGTASGGFFIGDAVGLSVNGGGISANVVYRVKEKSTTQSSYMAGNVTTSVAGINLALGYESTALTGGADTSSIVVAGNTSVAGIRLNAAYGSNSGKGGTAKDTSGYLVGASMPVVGALSAGITYAANTKLDLGTQTTFSLQYDLAKSTYAYLNYSSFSKSVGGAGALGGQVANDNGGLAAGKSLMAVGVAHSF